MSGERWEDMPDVVEAAMVAFDVGTDPATDAFHPDDVKITRDALSAAVSVVPVVPVRVLRQWIEQERQLLAKAKPLDAHDRGFKVALDEVASVLNDYEKENPDA